MRIYIKEWPNKTASIITAEGQVIWTFSSSESARQACREWRSLMSPNDIESYDTASVNSTCYSCLT
ncbi:MAG: hypothetical protein PVH54_12410 [Gammaproteobacteria bacterium]|jgi:hypothetical protein